MLLILLLMLCLISSPGLAGTWDGTTATKIDGSTVTKWDGATFVAAAGCTSATLWIDESSTGDYTGVADVAGEVFVGQRNWVPPANKHICSILVNVRAAGGSDGYKMELWTQSGSDLNTVVCSSGTLTISTAGEKTFTFADPGCSVTTTGTYAITISNHDYTYSGTNNLSVYTKNTATSAGVGTIWWDDKTYHDDLPDSEDFAFKINAY